MVNRNKLLMDVYRWVNYKKICYSISNQRMCC
ncbi:hypothetical protein J2S15_003475 [Breznakia pachnodae]|uniref:Uncharacterized protein n=1 Tax=Breznakia pachnodae TaxID=265178 RepID=A0ABU0E7M9_9FIRM|nr:hypothetical protein [Breznakia pachnodae]